MRIPKVLAIHDISCAGRASLTVILPVLAACGIEAIPLPTAVLSNHLAFSHVSSLDFTPYMQSFMDAIRVESEVNAGTTVYMEKQLRLQRLHRLLPAEQ